MVRLPKSGKLPRLKGINPSYSIKTQQLFYASPIRLGITEIRGDMKNKLAVIAAMLITGLSPITASYANVKPVVESFTFTPNEVELISANTNVAFELIVSHPSGIKNITTQVSLTGLFGSTLATSLTRTDSPVNLALSKVTFRGTLTVPQNINTGAYVLSVAEVSNNSSAGYEYGTGVITSSKLRDLVGAESALLIRNNGELNLVYDTFVGPTHNTSLGIAYRNPSVYNNNNPPIWKVGETYTPSKYFESWVSSLPLVVTTSSPTICSTDGKELKFIATGSCTFKVSTLKTKDYILKEIVQDVTITAARSKPELVIGTIDSQTSKNLPKTIEIFRVYSPSGNWVLPQTTTPTVCIAAGFYVQIIGGGTCALTYQSEATTTYLASDLYKISFEVTRDPQTITFSPPTSVNLSIKTVALSATTSSGGALLYTTSTPDNCSIAGTTLNLLKSGNCSVIATQPGTSTLAPISATATVMIAGTVAPTKKTITCIKGKKTKKVSGVSPKCPKGFKVKSK
jgi:hypothetical protein